MRGFSGFLRRIRLIDVPPPLKCGICFFLLLFFSWNFGNVQSEEHSLEYIYTALSKPINLTGIYEFTAMTLLDGKQIDWYNSQDKRKIPRQKWMEEKYKRAYWEAGTQTCKDEEQWFKDNIIVVMEQMRHNSSDLHVLQWRRGCVGEGRPGVADHQPSRALTFTEGFNQYGYDGEDFLRLNFSTSQWDSMVPLAEPTKTRWDQIFPFKTYTKEYLETHCMNQLDGFMTHAEQDLKQHSPPEVFMYAKKSNIPDKMILHCLATGFYPKDAEVNIYRNGVIVNEGDGVTSSGVRSNGVWPNGTVDDTYQLNKSVEILKSDHGNYICNITHRSLREPVSTKWNGECLDCGGDYTGIIVGVLVVLLLVAGGGVGYYLYTRRRAGRRPVAANGNVPNGVVGHGHPDEEMILLSGDGPAAAPANGVDPGANGDVQPAPPDGDVQPAPPDGDVQPDPQAVAQPDPPNGAVAVTVPEENPSNLDRSSSLGSLSSSEGNSPEESRQLLYKEEPLTAGGLISAGDESAYRDEVEPLCLGGAES